MKLIMNETIETPTWLRYLNIGFGFGFLLLALITLLNFGLSKQILLILLSFALVLICLTRVINGISDIYLSEGLRYLNMFIGSFGLAIALTIIVLPELPIDTAIFLLAVGLSLQGIARIAIGSLDTTFTNWIRSLLVSIGAITLVLTLIVIFFQTTDEAFLLRVLAFTFLINGLARIAKGMAGHDLFEGTLLDRSKQI